MSYKQTVKLGRHSIQNSVRIVKDKGKVPYSSNVQGTNLSEHILRSAKRASKTQSKPKKACRKLQKLDQSFKDVLLKIFQEYKERDDYKIDLKDFNDISTLLTEYTELNEDKDKTACKRFLKYITNAQLDNFKNNLEGQTEFTGLITSLHDFKRANDPAERRSNESGFIISSTPNISKSSNSSDFAFGKIRKNKSVKKKKGKGKKPSLRRKKKNKGN